MHPELYPNLSNPFVYSPVEYDHAITALLATLNLTGAISPALTGLPRLGGQKLYVML